MGTIINPHLELTQSSPYQDTLASSYGTMGLTGYNKATSLSEQEYTRSSSYHLTHLSCSQACRGDLHLLSDSNDLKLLDPSTRSHSDRSHSSI